MKAMTRAGWAAVLCASCLGAFADTDCRKPAPAASQPAVVVRTLPPPPLQVQCGDSSAVQSVSLTLPAAAAPASAAQGGNAKAGKGDGPARGGVSQAKFERLIDASQWVAAGFGAVAVLLLLLAFWLTDKQGGLSFVSHWGGFGGTAHGWHLSAAGMALAGAAVIALLALVLWAQLLQLASPVADKPVASAPGPN